MPGLGEDRDGVEVRLDRAARALFADPVRYRLHDLEVISADFRPHLVVAEMLELAGHALGARLGIPVVTHGISPQYPSSMAPLFATALESARESAGPDVPSLVEYLAHPYLDLGPRSLVPPDLAAWAHEGRIASGVDPDI